MYCLKPRCDPALSANAHGAPTLQSLLDNFLFGPLFADTFPREEVRKRKRAKDRLLETNWKRDIPSQPGSWVVCLRLQDEKRTFHDARAAKLWIWNWISSRCEDVSLFDHPDVVATCVCESLMHIPEPCHTPPTIGYILSVDEYVVRSILDVHNVCVHWPTSLSDTILLGQGPCEHPACDVKMPEGAWRNKFRHIWNECIKVVGFFMTTYCPEQDGASNAKQVLDKVMLDWQTRYKYALQRFAHNDPVFKQYFFATTDKSLVYFDSKTNPRKARRALLWEDVRKQILGARVCTREWAFVLPAKVVAFVDTCNAHLCLEFGLTDDDVRSLVSITSNWKDVLTFHTKRKTQLRNCRLCDDSPCAQDLVRDVSPIEAMEYLQEHALQHGNMGQLEVYEMSHIWWQDVSEPCTEVEVELQRYLQEHNICVFLMDDQGVFRPMWNTC